MPVHIINAYSDALKDVLKTNVRIRNAFDLRKTVQSVGAWDTGATVCAITPRCAQKLKLQPLDNIRATSASGQFESRTYLIRVEIEGLGLSIAAEAIECEHLKDDETIDLLIGMNIITKGDFVISNQDGKTSMSFRVPAGKRIEF